MRALSGSKSRTRSGDGMQPPPDPRITDYLDMPALATPPSWAVPQIGGTLHARWCDPTTVTFLPDRRTTRWALEVSFLELSDERQCALSVGDTVVWWTDIGIDDEGWANAWFPQRVLDVRGNSETQMVVTLCDRLYTETDPDFVDVVPVDVLHHSAVSPAGQRALLQVFRLNTTCPVCGAVGFGCPTFNEPEALPRMRNIDGNRMDLDSPTYRCRCDAAWLVGEAGTVVVVETGPDYTRVPKWAKDGRPKQRPT